MGDVDSFTCVGCDTEYDVDDSDPFHGPYACRGCVAKADLDHEFYKTLWDAVREIHNKGKVD